MMVLSFRDVSKFFSVNTANNALHKRLLKIAVPLFTSFLNKKKHFLNECVVAAEKLAHSCDERAEVEKQLINNSFILWQPINFSDTSRKFQK